MTRNGAPLKAFRASATIAVTKGAAGVFTDDFAGYTRHVYRFK